MNPETGATPKPPQPAPAARHVATASQSATETLNTAKLTTKPPTSAILELRQIEKSYGGVEALCGVSLTVHSGRVQLILGDNGAGKSTLLQIMAGRITQTSGDYLLDGIPVRFTSPREAISAGIATVYQDLALPPLMPVWRAFFLGQELTRGPGLGAFKLLDIKRMRQIAWEELAGLGIELDDIDRSVQTLSGGQRQSVAIARALHFGARVLILDEPTAALGVKQSELVLSLIERSRQRGIAVVFITHNPRHALRTGDDFLVLRQGRVAATFAAGEADVLQLTEYMSGS